ncbi:uncharacterized protein LOC119358849 [Triticum dicoccoides]|uniref:uncharacterized protein LOC119358849 n=1 Tax=Triticum dicoccoides TaxID=85692 RepID=UPI00188DFE0B|nr:uncharacterized protein LOC119358849 [Triticum dicoccoides]
MEMATGGDDATEFLFPLPDLAAAQPLVSNGANQTLICAPAESSIGDAGEAALAMQLDFNSTCDGIALFAPTSEQSTGKGGPQAPGWTKRIRVGRAPNERPPMCCQDECLGNDIEKIFRKEN